MKNYVLSGFKTPTGIDSSEKVVDTQRKLGVEADGIWGPKTQAAYDRALAEQTDPQIVTLLSPAGTHDQRACKRRRQCG